MLTNILNGCFDTAGVVLTFSFSAMGDERMWFYMDSTGQEYAGPSTSLIGAAQFGAVVLNREFRKLLKALPNFAQKFEKINVSMHFPSHISCLES